MPATTPFPEHLMFKVAQGLTAPLDAAPGVASAAFGMITTTTIITTRKRGGSD